MTNLFKKAVEGKYRFNFKGVLTVEDLFDLSLTELDSLYKVLNKELKLASEDSLLESKSKSNTVLENKIEIIKTIVSEKVHKQREQERLIESNIEKQKIMKALQEKRDNSLTQKTEAELEEMLNNLD